jgi:hypothetical protein
VKCHEKAEGHALGPVDPTCVDKVHLKFDGGPTPERGCFEKLELPSHCFTEDDTADLREVELDAFVDSVCRRSILLPAPIIDRCSVAVRAHPRRQPPQVPRQVQTRTCRSIRPASRKVLLKFDGGPLPGGGVSRSRRRSTSA